MSATQSLSMSLGKPALNEARNNKLQCYEDAVGDAVIQNFRADGFGAIYQCQPNGCVRQPTNGPVNLPGNFAGNSQRSKLLTYNLYTSCSDCVAACHN